eukprot:gene11719-5058_t
MRRSYAILMLIIIILVVNLFVVGIWKHNYVLNTLFPIKLLPKKHNEDINQRLLDSFYPNEFLSHKPDFIIYKFVNKKYFKRKFDQNSFISEISIITQCTENRFARLNDLTKIYSGPISVTYLKWQEESNEKTMERIRKEFPHLLENIYLHIYQYKIPHFYEYRINEMRNIAWKFVKTRYIFILDLDFFPSSNFKEEIEKIAKKKFFKEIIASGKGFLSFAAFELDCKDIKRFSYQNCKKGDVLLPNHPSQRATDIEKWNGSKKIYRVNYELFYEPYGIASSKMTIFDPIFLYGDDKTSFFYELAAQKIEFFIAPKIYIGHMPHEKSFFTRYITSLGIQRFQLFEKRIRRQYDFNYLCDHNNIKKKKFHKIGSHSCICKGMKC